MLKLLHIFFAIVALGSNLTYPLWVRAAEREPEHRRFTLARIRLLDRHVAIPAYALLAVTGLALAVLGGIPLRTGWLASSIALYVSVAVLGLAVYAPLSQLRVARRCAQDPDLAVRTSRDTSANYWRKLSRTFRSARPERVRVP